MSPMAGSGLLRTGRTPTKGEDMIAATSQTIVFDAVWDALQGYRALVSSTPQSFGAKVVHVPAEVRDRTAVIMIDVLRATTTLNAVIAAGGRGVHLAVKPARGFYQLTPPFGNSDEWVFGGEENGHPIRGGVVGNSPLQVEEDVVRDRFLKFFSTNGARGVAAVEEAGFSNIFLASLANIAATARHVARSGYQLAWGVCGGFYGSSTLEDVVCAGRGIGALIEERFLSASGLDDEARIAHLTATAYADDEQLVRSLATGQVGTLLNHIGRGVDVAAVASGRGMRPGLWRAMQTTVIARHTIQGVSIFAPVTRED